MFAGLLLGIILIVGGLAFLPGTSLGPSSNNSATAGFSDWFFDTSGPGFSAGF
jgi:hypothetical protein